MRLTVRISETIAPSGGYYAARCNDSFTFATHDDDSEKFFSKFEIFALLIQDNKREEGKCVLCLNLHEEGIKRQNALDPVIRPAVTGTGQRRSHSPRRRPTLADSSGGPCPRARFSEL